MPTNTPGLSTAFAEQIRAFAEKADNRANEVVRKIIFGLDESLVLKTPVGNPSLWQNPSAAPPGYVGGRLRANWQHGTDSINTTVTFNIDKSGGATISRLVGAVPERAIGHVHYITNSLPYANRIEEGHSRRQAPQGMVGLTILEFDPIVRRAAAELV